MGGATLAPETHVNKPTMCRLKWLDQSLINSLGKGVKTEDGDFLQVKGLKVIRSGQRIPGSKSRDEGKNRHIRRMLEAHGIEEDNPGRNRSAAVSQPGERARAN